MKRDKIQIGIDFIQIPNTQISHEQIDTHQNNRKTQNIQTQNHANIIENKKYTTPMTNATR